MALLLLRLDAGEEASEPRVRRRRREGGQGRPVAKADRRVPRPLGAQRRAVLRRHQFPERYRHGAFIAFHGSTIRMPYSQAGYFVAFVPFRDGAPSGPWEVFADGFAGVDPIVSTSDAVARPMGLAQGPDGALYVSDSVKGKIWRVTFEGDRTAFGAAQLASMEARKTSQAHIRQPDERKDALGARSGRGRREAVRHLLRRVSSAGWPGRWRALPARGRDDWVSGDLRRLVSIVLNGMAGEIEVGGNAYNGVMPGHAFLTDEEVSQLVTFLRQNFGNHATPIRPERSGGTSAPTRERPADAEAAVTTVRAGLAG